MPLSPGTRLAACDDVDTIGVDGMGKAYRARGVTLDRGVAREALATRVHIRSRVPGALGARGHSRTTQGFVD